MAKTKARKRRRSSDVSEAEQSSTGKKIRKRQDNEQRHVKKQLDDNSLFGQLMKQAGYVLMADDTPNQINVDQSVFQKELIKAIKRHHEYPEVIEEFTMALQNHLEDPVRLKYSLLQTVTSPDCDSARGSSQDSMIKVLLGIDLLQPRIANILLEKLPEFTEGEEVFDHSDAVNIPHLIMNQFRWLDHIVKSKELVDKMFEVIGITSVAIQREIITCIPEVVEDCHHSEVATQLKEILQQGSQVTVPILDALVNLNLRPELVAEIRLTVLQMLPSADFDDLPVIVKFILQSVTPTDALEVINDVRSNLDFPGNMSAMPTTSPQDRHRNRSSTDTSKGIEVLTLDAIRSAIRFQKCIAEGWMKSIESVSGATEHKVIDVFVLLILHSNGNRRKIVESLVRNKIRCGHFNEELLHTTFSGHTQVVREYFTSVLSLAEILLRSPEPPVASFGCALYKQAFIYFDLYCQQEIVGALVTHIGSGYAGEVDSSLDILSDLVESRPNAMAPFAVFIKGVLDYLDNLSTSQIRKVFWMLSNLAFRNNQDVSLIQDDMHMVIRKQLSSNSSKYKRIGVIGAIAIIHNMAYHGNVETESGDLSESLTTSSIENNNYKQVISLLELVRSSSSKMPESSALFFDELAAIVQKGEMDPKVQKCINESILSDFQDDFVVDIGPEKTNSDAIPIEMMFNLEEGDTEEGIVVNLMPLLQKSEKQSFKANLAGKDKQDERHISPICLSPHFRLLRICEEIEHKGNLEGIDALLGCPIYMFSKDYVDKMDSLTRPEKEMMCTAAFLTLNWFREIINAFASQTDSEMKGKVLSRLQNITEVQQVLEKCLAATPGYVPPLANFDSDEVSVNLLPGQPSTSGVNTKKGRKAKSKKTNLDKENANNTCTQSQLNVTTNTQPDKTSALKDTTTEIDKSSIELSQYRAYFRELDISVFKILNCGLVTKAVLDTDMHTKETTVLQIQPPQLEFLLEDLSGKLDHALIASASKRRTFLKTKTDKNTGFSHLDQYSSVDIAKKTIKLLPALCDHLESASGFFQALMADNDGLIDGPGMHTDEAQLIARCFHLLLQSLNSLFSWCGFVMSENRSLLKNALSILTSRIKATGTTQVTIHELLKQSFQYLENFSSSVTHIKSAVTLMKLLSALNERNGQDDFTEKLATLSESLLKREWFSLDGQKEKGSKFNEHLQLLIKMYVSYSADTLAAIENLATVGVTQLINADQTGCSETYPTLTRNSFPSFYRLMLIELVDVVKKFPIMKSSDSDQVKVQRLIRWDLAIKILYVLVSLIKVFDGRVNLASILKYGRMFVEIFVRQCMPMLDNIFRHHREDVQGLLKNLQQSTRTLQHMCSHTKVLKDVSLTNHVPPLKKCLEVFVYRVKAMLAMHKCHDAFWIGNLKNRDLQGEEILSQVSRRDDDESEDEDMPDDDDDDDSDVTMEEESVASNEADVQGGDHENELSEVY
ncbi:Fanconi anemia group D2 protein-like isoform X2 [Ptychodera flava]